MKKGLYALLMATMLLAPDAVTAQRSGTNSSYARVASGIVSKYQKEMSQVAQKAKDAAASDLASAPYLYRLLGPGVYYRSALADGFHLDYDVPGTERTEQETTEELNRRAQANMFVDHALMDAYATRPDLFRYYDTQIESESVVASEDVVGAQTDDLASIYDKVDEIKDVAEVVDSVEVDLQIVKPNFWTTKGAFSMQFAQNYFSENWYKGGNNNVALLSNLVLEANYNDQKRVQWDNKIDMRLGFVTATSDSCHRYLPNNDKIYLASKLGIKAAKNWFYTVSAEANSQFLPGYKSNDRLAYSKFMSPLDVYVSLGMDWKPTFKNGNSFSLALLPLSYKMRYISSPEETIHSSYNMVGKDFQQDFGSKIEFKSEIKVVKGLTWKSRCYFFTAYEYAEAELENVFSFQFNKYISSEVYTLWRFDDNRSRDFYDTTLGYFQFIEYFTLGLAYNF